MPAFRVLFIVEKELDPFPLHMLHINIYIPLLVLSSVYASICFSGLLLLSF